MRPLPSNPFAGVLLTCGISPWQLGPRPAPWRWPWLVTAGSVACALGWERRAEVCHHRSCHEGRCPRRGYCLENRGIPKHWPFTRSEGGCGSIPRIERDKRLDATGVSRAIHVLGTVPVVFFARQRCTGCWPVSKPNAVTQLRLHELGSRCTSGCMTSSPAAPAVACIKVAPANSSGWWLVM